MEHILSLVDPMRKMIIALGMHHLGFSDQKQILEIPDIKQTMVQWDRGGELDYFFIVPDSKVHGAKIEPIWGRQEPGGPHFGPMNLAIRGPCEHGHSASWLFLMWHENFWFSLCCWLRLTAPILKSNL